MQPEELTSASAQEQQPNIGMVEAAQNLETAIGMHFTKVLSGDKGAGIAVGEVDDVDAASFADGLIGERVFGVPDENFHPGWGFEVAVAFRVGLR